MTIKNSILNSFSLPRGAPVILFQWLTLPIFGKVAGVVFLILLPLCRMKTGPRVPELRSFAYISLLYTVYIIIRSLAAGSNAKEPIGDTLPLILTAALSFWAVRQPVRLDMQWLFRGTVVMLVLVFVLTLFERIVLGVWRPELLLGNPLNLTPLLLVPCMFVTMTQFAPSRIWIWVGLVAFFLGGYVIGGLSQSRGLFLGLGMLVLVRLVFEVSSPAPVQARLRNSLSIAATMGVLIVTVAVNPAISGRYTVAAQTFLEPSGAEEWSTGLRITMLTEGWKTFLDRPLVGHGPQNRFDAVFPDTSSFPTRFSHLHNDFLTHAVAGGLIAVILLFMILLAPAWAGFRNNAGLDSSLAHNRRQIGVLTSFAFIGVAAVNNVFFVSISAFTTALSLISVLLVLSALAAPQKVSNVSATVTD